MSSQSGGPELGAECGGGDSDEIRLVELFSGGGGFSLGAKRAGLKVVAAFDNDPILTSSFATNFPDTRLVLSDVAQLNGDSLRSAARLPIHGIFGGPPCQGFSDIGHRDASDPRRQLLGHFFRIVAEVRPTFFVMENVRGLAYSDARGVLDEALKLVADRYEILGPSIWDACQFGAATKRQRLFVIGIHKDRGEGLTVEEIAVLKRPPATVRAAISDLTDATPVGEVDGFDIWRIGRPGRPYDYARNLRAPDRQFTGHRKTTHTPQVVRRFEKIEPGHVDAIGRHPRLDWSGQCPALRAGTGSDRGSYQAVRPLHPDEPRVITVREAARLQGFPDVQRFHPTVWHSFRMIGNSVSPIVAEAIFTAIKTKLKDCGRVAVAAE